MLSAGASSMISSNRDSSIARLPNISRSSMPETNRKGCLARCSIMRPHGNSSHASQMIQIIGHPVTRLVGKHPFQELSGKILGAPTEGDRRGHDYAPQGNPATHYDDVLAEPQLLH